MMEPHAKARTINTHAGIENFPNIVPMSSAVIDNAGRSEISRRFQLARPARLRSAVYALDRLVSGRPTNDIALNVSATRSTATQNQRPMALRITRMGSTRSTEATGDSSSP